MGCNCGRGRARNTTRTLVQPAGGEWRVTYTNGATQVVPDEKTARAIVAVNGGTAAPLDSSASSES